MSLRSQEESESETATSLGTYIVAARPNRVVQDHDAVRFVGVAIESSAARSRSAVSFALAPRLIAVANPSWAALSFRVASSPAGRGAKGTTSRDGRQDFSTKEPIDMTSERRRKRRQVQPASSNRKTRFAFLESGALHAGALAAALLSVATLVFFATDRLSFLHRHAPAERGAVFSALRLSDHVTLAEFAERTHLSPASLTMPLPHVGPPRGVASAQYVSDGTGSTVGGSVTTDTAGPADSSNAD